MKYGQQGQAQSEEALASCLARNERLGKQNYKTQHQMELLVKAKPEYEERLTEMKAATKDYEDKIELLRKQLREN